MYISINLRHRAMPARHYLTRCKHDTGASHSYVRSLLSCLIFSCHPGSDDPMHRSWVLHCKGETWSLHGAHP